MFAFLQRSWLWFVLISVEWKRRQHFLWSHSIPKPFLGELGLSLLWILSGVSMLRLLGLFLQAWLEEKAWIRAGNPYLLPVCILHSLNHLQVEKRNLSRKKTHIQCSQYSREKNPKTHKQHKGKNLHLNLIVALKEMYWICRMAAASCE